MTICGALPETNIASATLGLENEFPFGQVWECILAKNSGRLQLLILSTSGVSLAQEHGSLSESKFHPFFPNINNR